MDTLSAKRRLAEAQKAADRAKRYASAEPEEWADITAVEELEERLSQVEKRPPLPSAPELEAHGPGGFKMRLFGVTGGHIVTVVVVIAVVVVVWLLTR